MRRYLSVFSPNVPAWGYVAFLVMALGWVHVVPKFWVFLGGAACLLAISGLGLSVVVGWAGEVSLASAALATGTSTGSPSRDRSMRRRRAGGRGQARCPSATAAV